MYNISQNSLLVNTYEVIKYKILFKYGIKRVKDVNLIFIKYENLKQNVNSVIFRGHLIRDRNKFAYKHRLKNRCFTYPETHPFTMHEKYTLITCYPVK